MQEPLESLLWAGSLLQTGNSEVNGFEIGSRKEVTVHAFWIWASHPSPTLNFLWDGFPSVLGPPWSLSGSAVSLNGDTPIFSTLLQSENSVLHFPDTPSTPGSHSSYPGHPISLKAGTPEPSLPPRSRDLLIVLPGGRDTLEDCDAL